MLNDFDINFGGMMQTKDNITLDMLLEEINEVRNKALDNDDYKTALSCTLSKAKLLGGGRAIEYRESKRDDPLGLKIFN